MRICLADLPPKLPPKGLGTGQHRIAPFCTHGTKPILSLGTQYHQTQQNSTLTHKFWISHNPKVVGSNPAPQPKKLSCSFEQLSFFLFWASLCLRLSIHAPAAHNPKGAGRRWRPSSSDRAGRWERREIMVKFALRRVILLRSDIRLSVEWYLLRKCEGEYNITVSFSGQYHLPPRLKLSRRARLGISLSLYK